MSSSYSNLPPDLAVRVQQALERQKRYEQAQMGLFQGGLPQGRMVGNYYIRPGPFDYISRFLPIVLAAYEQKGANEELQKAVGEYQTRLAKEWEGIQGALPSIRNLPMPTDPTVRNLVEALVKSGLDVQGAIKKNVAGRVPLEQVGQVLEGDFGNLRSRGEVKVINDVPVVVPTEGDGPVKPLSPPWQMSQIPSTAPGQPPIQVQQNPLTGFTKELSEPRVTVNVGDKPSPYASEFMQNQAKQDVQRLEAHRQNVATLQALDRITDIANQAKGQWTGGPLEMYIRYMRGAADQLKLGHLLPENDAVLLNNAKLQVEFASTIARALMSSSGARLSENDRKALEKAFPNFELTPQQLPAFVDQFKRMLTDTIKRDNQYIRTLRSNAARSGIPLWLIPEEFDVDAWRKARLREQYGVTGGQGTAPTRP